MDVENKQLESLLNKTDEAFKRLLQNPASDELNSAYESAKSELDHYLSDMRNQLKQRYKHF